MTMMKKLLASAVASALMVGGAQAEISNNTVKIGYLADMSGRTHQAGDIELGISSQIYLAR